ncbi:unnamed protein product [Meganyctiphanes norvegica]|uniref:Uncharacterized protein n=1 Tax=Meganyctiphanes norvegica TaxID=48144 RepID=A0AAV2Q4J8_MEGNR
MSWLTSFISGSSDTPATVAPNIEQETPGAETAAPAPNAPPAPEEGPRSRHCHPRHGHKWAHHWGHHNNHGHPQGLHMGPFGVHDFGGPQHPGRGPFGEYNTWNHGHHGHNWHDDHHGWHLRRHSWHHRRHHCYQGPPEGSQHQFFATWIP